MKEVIKSDNHINYNSTNTLYLPGLYGQWKVWNERVSIISSQVSNVIQMGNIIGFNDSILEKQEGTRNFNSVLLENILTAWATSESWIQLVGPNEIIGLSDKDNNYIDKDSSRFLRDAYFGGDDKPIFKIAHAHNDRLYTHGGLTSGEWTSIGQPDNAYDAADRLNEKYANKLFFGECIRTGSIPQLDANPVFCDDLHELYPSWLYSKKRCPFEQVIASSLNSVRGQYARKTEMSPLYWVDDSQIKLPRIGSIMTIRDTQFFGLDINLNKEYLTTMNSAWRLWLEESFH